MKWLLCLLAFMPAMRQVDYARIQLDAVPRGIVAIYRNANFLQQLEARGEGLEVRTRSLNFLELDLTYRVRLDPRVRLAPEVRALAVQFLESSVTLKDYLLRIRDYMHSRIHYSPDPGDQTPAAVLARGRADCVGMTGLVGAWLDAVNVDNRSVSGFFLMRRTDGGWDPQPHRWLEIRLRDGFAFFFDPQHRAFSPCYLVVRPGLDFQRVRRFRVVRVRLQTKLENG